MKILYVEPFLGGSHQQWIEGFKINSAHEIQIMGLSDKFWKWRMIGGAVELAKRFNNLSAKPDIIMVSDMLDLATFKALISFEGPFVLYFHENQITYPLSFNDTDIEHKRDNYYGFINFTSALIADEIWFNSHFHKTSFMDALKPFLNQFPDYNLLNQVSKLEVKSKVAHLGMNLKMMDSIDIDDIDNEIPIILWNHRWEHDKNPQLFFESLLKLQQEHIPFELVALGENRGRNSEKWQKYEIELKDHILHWGYVKSYEEYIKWLKKSDILAVTSHHDYFGLSVLEAIYAGCYPLLPDALAYPEHILDEMKPSILYDEGDFYSRLKSLLISKKYLINNDKIQSCVKKYDWSVIAPFYDQMFKSLHNNFFN